MGMIEEWRPISVDGGKYVGKYQVSNLGSVRSDPASRVQGSKPGWILSIATDNKGYKQVFLWFEAKVRAYKVHRLVATEFLGERPTDSHVNHIDGNKANNAVSNLEFVSAEQNMWHAIRTMHDNKAINVFGEKLSVPEALVKYGAPGLSKYTVHTRLKQLKWSAEKAITTPSARSK